MQTVKRLFLSAQLIRIAIDFSKIKAVISFGGKTSEGNFDFAAVQSAKETGDVSLPFALSVECVGTIGEADISPALNPTYSMKR